MREQFRADMQELYSTLTQEARASAKAMHRAANSLKNANLALAEQVIDADVRINALERNVDEMAISLLARQAPVASDLRTVISAMRLSTTLERMGDLARHVAYVARGRYPRTAATGQVYDLLIEMATQATQMGETMVCLIETQDISIAEQIEKDDDVLDELHRKSFEFVLDEDLEMTRQQITDLILLGRYLERYGDQVVNVATRMQFLITGMAPDFE